MLTPETAKKTIVDYNTNRDISVTKFIRAVMLSPQNGLFPFSENEAEPALRDGFYLGGLNDYEQKVDSSEFEEFIENVFPPEFFKGHVLTVNFDNEILYRLSENCQDSPLSEEAKAVIDNSRKQISNDCNFFTTQNIRDYLKVASSLEGVEEPEISNIFNLIATTQKWHEMKNDDGHAMMAGAYLINIHSLAARDLTNPKVLNAANEEERNLARKELLFNRLAHEFGHVLWNFSIIEQDFIESDSGQNAIKRITGIDLTDTSEFRELRVQKYQNIVQNTENGDFITEYTKRHVNNFGSELGLIAEEDFCEAVMLFLTNSEKLKNQFPERYEYIKRYLPFLREDLAQKYYQYDAEPIAA